MSWVVSEFGDKLLTKEGLKSTSDVLAGKKLIGIYFSAHWCPPCRGFTPILADFYNQLKVEHGDDVEFIFVSADRNLEAFREYFESMPFLALPYENREVNTKLASKYSISGIPTLIIVDTTGRVVDASGRTTVSRNTGNVRSALSKWYG